MVGIVLIGLLAGAVTLATRSYLVSGKQAVVRMEISKICQAIDTFYAGYDRYPTSDEGLAILRSGDDELLDLLAAAYRVRRRWFGNSVNLNYLINAKSGLCGEDCGYCSQSRVSKAEIPRYHLVAADEILDGARIAAERKAKTYCAVISGRSRW